MTHLSVTTTEEAATVNVNATLLGQSISLFIFVWFCMKYVWPPLITTLEERQKKISDSLLAADRAEKSLDLAKVEATKILEEAKSKAHYIVDQANKRRLRIIEDARKEALSERDRALSQAQSEIDVLLAKARSDLRKQVAVLSITGAEKILERSIEGNEHVDILNSMIARL